MSKQRGKMGTSTYWMVPKTDISNLSLLFYIIKSPKQKENKQTNKQIKTRHKKEAPKFH